FEGAREKIFAGGAMPSEQAASWADDYVAVTAIPGIGGTWGIDSLEPGSAGAAACVDEQSEKANLVMGAQVVRQARRRGHDGGGGVGVAARGERGAADDVEVLDAGHAAVGVNDPAPWVGVHAGRARGVVVAGGGHEA